MSSDSPGGTDEDLPAALRSMVRLFRLGFQHEPRLLILSTLLTMLQAVPDALFALWLKLLADALIEQRWTSAYAVVGAMAVSATSTWLLMVASNRISRRFRDRVTIALESHVARLQAQVPTLALHENPAYLDRLAVLRRQIFVLDHMYSSVLSTGGWLIRVLITLGLLASVHPLLILLLVFAVPTLVSANRRPVVERATEQAAAPHARLAEHLIRTTTTAGPGKEVRLTGLGSDLTALRRSAFQRWYGPIARARWGSAISYALGWAIFGVGYAIAIALVATGRLGPPAGEAATVGAVLLILAAGVRLAFYVNSTVGEIGFLRGIWLDGARRLVWLEDYVAAQSAGTDGAVPDRLRDGIRLAGVSFRYPGSDRDALEDVDLTIPAGTVVALVGENGAGKSTLVKLLAKLYEPTAGAVLIDGRPLSAMPPDRWREQVSGAFQDFYRFEFSAQRSIGLGDLPELDDPAAAEAATIRAGATDVIERLPEGLDSQLGPTWPGGQELSFGQWQKVALARGYMRTEPLLLILDEPTAALDAETEHALFERYAAAARSSTSGTITVLVSHRFSTVRMADLIVVLDGSRLVEVGTHAELIQSAGTYAELYDIQARAYG